MAWTAPSTFVAGAILTAAQLNTNVRDNTLAGGPIYTTEALRDAAITSPFEGQRAYITGSTIAAATGLVTAVPTGIQTIYNGAAWVCVTPVSADTTTSGTTTSTSFTPTLTAGGTNPSVTISTGTTALITFSLSLSSSSAGAAAVASIAVSGATTVAASDNYNVFIFNSTVSMTSSRTFVLTGLTAGTNTFTYNYKLGAAATGTFASRAITVQGIA
jgi:hypothetical protein